jgi:hypothetical protein
VSKSGSRLRGRLDGCGPFLLDAPRREDECRRDPPKTCEEDRSVIAKMTNATTERASVTATVHSLLEVDREMAVQAALGIASNAISIPASPTSPVLYQSPITRLWTSYS